MSGLKNVTQKTAATQSVKTVRISQLALQESKQFYVTRWSLQQDGISATH